jgi:toxin HigB-1
MITGFRHKGLKELFEKGKTSKLPQERVKKIKQILAVIHAAHDLQDISNPSYRLHRLKAPPFEGYWSIDISGNYRIIFEFEAGRAWHIDYIDTH